MLAVHDPSFGPWCLGPNLHIHPSPLPVHRAWTPQLAFSIVVDHLKLNAFTSKTDLVVVHPNNCEPLIWMSFTTDYFIGGNNKINI
jgi:hypothetical protein